MNAYQAGQRDLFARMGNVTLRLKSIEDELNEIQKIISKLPDISEETTMPFQATLKSVQENLDGIMTCLVSTYEKYILKLNKRGKQNA